MFPLLEEVDLHITQSLLQLRNLLFSLTYFPLQFVLDREDEALEMIQSIRQHLQTSNCLCPELVTGVEPLPAQVDYFILLQNLTRRGQYRKIIKKVLRQGAQSPESYCHYTTVKQGLSWGVQLPVVALLHW